MAKAKEKKLMEHTIEELEAQCEEVSKSLFEIRNEFRINRKLDKPHLLKKYRKDRARALTAINIKKLENKGS